MIYSSDAKRKGYAEALETIRKHWGGRNANILSKLSVRKAIAQARRCR